MVSSMSQDNVQALSAGQGTERSANCEQSAKSVPESLHNHSNPDSPTKLSNVADESPIPTHP